MTHARVMLWGRQIGAVLWDEERELAVFEYTPAFLHSGIELSPLVMPLRAGPHDFPALPRETFRGLPGLLADSLPDRFGTALINRWLAEQGRTPESFDPVERLCYIGRRGMGALEFEPSTGPQRRQGGPVDIAPLVELASRVLAARQSLAGVLTGEDDRHAMQEILRVGTSAGGARAKALLAWNETTGEFHSGQPARISRGFPDLSVQPAPPDWSIVRRCIAVAMDQGGSADMASEMERQTGSGTEHHRTAASESPNNGLSKRTTAIGSETRGISGLSAGQGYSQWLLKFDGVSGNADKEVADPLGYGRLEYACYYLARQAGIQMSECRLFEEGGRAHFMTRRFDRTPEGGKLHMQSLCALRHFDFNLARAYSYEQAIETIRMLGLGRDALREQVRRALLNVVIRNQDDHTRNIAFLMDRNGKWQLAPAFDVVYSYNPTGAWTSQHQMSLAGKTDDFTLDDLIAFGRYADLKPTQTRSLLADILAAVDDWEQHVAAAAVPPELARRARAGFRTFQR